MKHHLKHNLAVREEARRSQQKKIVGMAMRARRTGKTVRGFDAKQLRAMAVFMS